MCFGGNMRWQHFVSVFLSPSLFAVSSSSFGSRVHAAHSTRLVLCPFMWQNARRNDADLAVNFRFFTSFSHTSSLPVAAASVARTSICSSIFLQLLICFSPDEPTVDLIDPLSLVSLLRDPLKLVQMLRVRQKRLLLPLVLPAMLPQPPPTPPTRLHHLRNKREKEGSSPLSPLALHS